MPNTPHLLRSVLILCALTAPLAVACGDDQGDGDTDGSGGASSSTMSGATGSTGGAGGAMGSTGSGGESSVGTLDCANAAATCESIGCGSGESGVHGSKADCAWACGSTLTCNGNLNLQGSGPPSPFISDKAEANCILTALENGTPGRLSWTFVQPGLMSRTVVVDVTANGTAFVRRGRMGTDGPETSATLTGPIPLAPAAFYTDCLQKTDDQDIIDNCFEMMFTGCN